MPNPSPVDPTQIGPGWWGFVVFLVLLSATVLLLRSLLHHLRRVESPATSGQGESNLGERRIEVMAHNKGKFAGLYPPGYLEKMRKEDWPE